MKGKRYTKKQIAEAIAFWQRILENKSKLLDALVDEFGYGSVFNNVPAWFTIKKFELTFSIVNKHVFGSKLKKWPFAINDESCIDSNALYGYVCSLVSNAEKQKYDVVLENMIIDNDEYKAPCYMFSSRLMGADSQCSLPLAVSLLAHEMIHQWNYEIGDEGRAHWLDSAHGREHDPHDRLFEKWMNEINAKHGLHIAKRGFRTIADISVDASNVLTRFAGNDYKNESTESKIYGHKVIKHTDDWSAFTTFM